jgi:PKD repeat protein
VDNGSYTVTLTVTDTLGGVGSDWLLVTVENVSPTLSAFPDQEIMVGGMITVNGTITDPGLLDTQTVEIDWADGLTETLKLAAGQRQFLAEHVYAEPGEYSVTVRATDKDGGWDQKTFMVTINPILVYLPFIHR